MLNLKWQTDPRHDVSRIVLLTGSAGGGKSRIAAQKLHDFCLRYRGATALVVRKARVSITNSAAEFLQESVIGNDPRVRHMPSKSRFEYANRSKLMYTGLDDEEQRKRIRSIGGKGGIDIAWMEEATEFEEDDFNAVLARLRGQAAPWRQVILTTVSICRADSWLPQHRGASCGRGRGQRVSICRADSWLPQPPVCPYHGAMKQRFQSAAQILGFPNVRHAAPRFRVTKRFNLPRRFLASPTR